MRQAGTQGTPALRGFFLLSLTFLGSCTYYTLTAFALVPVCLPVFFLSFFLLVQNLSQIYFICYNAA